MLDGNDKILRLVSKGFSSTIGRKSTREESTRRLHQLSKNSLKMTRRLHFLISSIQTKNTQKIPNKLAFMDNTILLVNFSGNSMK
jgi:hypothetical protein